MMSATDPSPNAQPVGSRKAYTGRVSKLLDNFGFIDDEVFFQLSVVRGGSVKLNDQVYVECHYSDHLPFKWNALSVQVLDPNSPNPFHPQNQQQQLPVPTPVLKLSDPRQDPRHQQQSSSNPTAYFRPAAPDAGDSLQSQQHFVSPAVTSVSAPSNTSRAAATFVSEYNQQVQQQQVGDSNGLHGHRGSRIPHMIQQQQQSQPQQQQAVFDSASAFSRNSGSSITYTSTPGAAFVSTQIQPVFNLEPALVSQPPVIGTSRGFPAGANAVPVTGVPVTGSTNHRSSRWDPAPRSSAPLSGNNNNNLSGSGPGRNNADAGNNKADNNRRRDRDRDRDSDRSAGGGKDRFGRDRSLFSDRESGSGGNNAARGDRGRDRNRPNRLDRSTESPVSTTGSLSVAGRPENLPKGEVLKRQVLSHDIRFRYGSKIHVPSDFEALIVNQSFELDIQGIPKPIKYKQVGSKREKTKDKKSEKEDKNSDKSEVRSEDSESKSESVKSEKKESGDEKTVTESEAMETESASSQKEVEIKVETADDDDDKTQDSTPQTTTTTTTTTTPTTTSSENGKKKTAKYGVKVILLSLPTMNQIYEQVFGYDFDHHTTSGYSYPLNKQISFIAYRNQNDGYSLLGGKFNPEVDGFIPGTEKPDLIRAAIRCVKEQANIDLSSCSRWISLGTFLYNRNESFGEDSCYEYSSVFMPDVWSLLEKPIPGIKEEAASEDLAPAPAPPQIAVTEEVNGHPAPEEIEILTPSAFLRPDESGNISGSSEDNAIPAGADIEPQFDELFSTDAADEKRELLNRILDLKVTELKIELDGRGVKLPRNVKKADLVKLLTEELEKEIKQELKSSTRVKAEPEPEAEAEQLQEPEPEASTANPDEKLEQEAKVIAETEAATGEKRHAEDSGEEPVAKKHHSDKKEEKASPSEKEKTSDKSVPAVIEYKGDLSFSVLSLHQALNHHKHDHFELSVAAELLREALLKHFALVIASCLKGNQAQLVTPSPEVDRRKGKAPTYMQLAFSYIDDRNHGYVLSEDVLQLLSLTGYKISKRSWQSLISGLEKIHYKSLEAPQVMIQPAALVDPLSSSSSSDHSSLENEAEGNKSSAPVFVKNGVMYDVENLVDQREKYTKAQAELKELQQVIAEKAKLLSEFETRQKKMTSAIEKQNDEICGIKREKDSLKIKNEELRKVIDSAFTSLNQGMKLIKDEPKL